MTNTTRLAMPLMSASQAQKHVTHNEAIEQLDAMVSAKIDGFVTAPAGGEGDGASYIVASGGTGDFDGWDYYFVYKLGGIWIPIIPADGMQAWSTADKRLYVFQTSLGGWVPITRLRVGSPLTFYIDASGNDSTGDGSTGFPWASFSKAIGVLNEYDCAGQAVSIRALDGAYSESVAVDRLPLGASTLSLVGNTTTPGNVTGLTFLPGGDARVRIDGFETESINISDRALVDMETSNMSYVGSDIHIAISDAAKVSLTAATETIAGTPKYHLFAATGGMISYQPNAVTLVSTPAFSVAYAAAYLNGLIYAPYWNSPSVVTGSATGKRHDADDLGVINTLGSDFPGDVAGTAVGGYYD